MNSIKIIIIINKRKYDGKTAVLFCIEEIIIFEKKDNIKIQFIFKLV
jgi:hypothetical protein